MSTKKIKLRSSFVLLCVGYFVLYSLFLALIYFCFSWYTGEKLDSAFISTSSILQYEEELTADDFSAIPAKITSNCSFIVFDDEGKRLYASSKEISEKIPYSALPYINDYMGSEWYTVSQNVNSKNEIYYIIMLKSYDEEGNEIVESSCILDSDYNIIKGNLFNGRKHLSEEEFNIIKGTYSKGSITEKYSYETENGEGRTLVCMYPVMSDADYYSVMEKTDRIWLFAVPVVIAVILLQAWLFATRIKKSITRINDAIGAYQRNEKFEVDKKKIPCEFLSIVDNFSNLLGWLNSLQREKDKIYMESRQVIADISHDLKTPLTVIQGYSKALNEGRVPEEKKEKYLETIYDKSVLSANLIDSLFDCVKMEHPDYKINPVTVDLSEQIKEILAEKYNEIEENGFDIDIDIPERRIEFAVDKKLFERLFENLLGNSLQYNPAGTTIFIKLREEKDSLVLTVADNGTGIPQELRENIFKPFVTSNNARSSGKGTGLGLAITKRIVELHGGSISLKDCGENSKYKTEFEIRFPRVMQ